MRESPGGSLNGPTAPVSAAVVVDNRGVVLFCTPAGAALLDCAPGTRCEAVAALLPQPGTDTSTGTGPGEAPRTGTTTVRDGSGRTERLSCTILPLSASNPAEPDTATHWLVLLTPGDPAPATEVRQDKERRRLELSHAVAVSIGSSLDVVVTAETLVDLLVPDFADLATVDLAETVLVGDEPPQLAAGGDVRLRRVAAAEGAEVSAERLLPVGEALPPVPDNALMRPLMSGRSVVISDIGLLHAALDTDAQEPWSFIPDGAHSSVAVPLFARGLVLGCVTVWRSRLSAAFNGDDAAQLEEVVSRAALSVDNARRYTKEHRSAIALQRSLLPHSVSHLAAAETAGVYQPAGGGVGVGGDWFDVIPLPSLRVAFVVGDVVGHGLDATAAMARLRTAVQTLADLDLEPDELLTHLDDLVLGFSTEGGSPQASRSELAVLGATCLYAVYDPVTRRCSASTAGHPPPAVLPPGEQPAFLDMVPGPPLGVGGMPFEVAEFDVAAGTVLAFFTDGLVESRGGDIEEGMARLRDSLSDSLSGPPTAGSRPLDEISRAVFDRLLPTAPTDDVALLLARTHEFPSGNIAEWEFEPDLSLVAHARELVLGQLAAWHLDDLGFVTELVVSELVTNAIRYAGGPVGLRLIRDRVLVCEVSDPSSTQPRLRRARETDEGGRGLFLVAQLTDRWGSRFTRAGKTIWTEQTIGAAHS